MDLETGNAHDADTNGTGWFTGFSAWTEGSLRHVPQDQLVKGLCIKWYHHPAGHEGGAKPVSTGRTLSILVTPGGRFQIDFSMNADFSGDVRTVVFEREGDFAIWGAGLHHRWRCIAPATIGTVRWTAA